ncbi:MAG: hypothetical protein FWG70_03400 [Oscillospiraceae bacterium]|nr:hypothetical protein [Oscillospiraceae bacterium]
MFTNVNSNQKRLLVKAIEKAKDGFFTTNDLISENSYNGYVRVQSILDELTTMRFISNICDGGYMLLDKAFTYEEDLAEYDHRLSPLKTNNVINVYGGGNNQIQQNTINSTQSIDSDNHFDYAKAIEVLTQTLNNIDSFNLSCENKESLTKVVNDAISSASNEKNSIFVKESLITIKNFLIGVTGSLAASGILYMLSNLRV